MGTAETVERFARLFEGRTDAFGTEQGGSLQGDVPWLDHLCGTSSPIGVYPMVFQHGHPHADQWMVKWGCVDLDVKSDTHKSWDYETWADALVGAQNLIAVLAHFGITGFIERTRGGGAHVWVFTEWVPASTMRRALLVACDVAGVPPSEVNPKSESFDSPDTLGNYVRLPYPGALGQPAALRLDARRVVYDLRGTEPLPAPLEWFLSYAESHRTSLEQLVKLSELWVPPAAERTIEMSGGVVLDESLRKRLGGLAFTILRDGPLDGGDRSGALFKLARSCAEDGLTADEALAVVTAGDLAWGKYYKRHDAERYLIQTIQRAYRSAT